MNFFRRTKTARWETTSCVGSIPLQKSTSLAQDFRKGRVEKTILPDEPGRVLFNGISWRARTQNLTKVDVGQKVVVLGRLSSTMLMVNPL